MKEIVRKVRQVGVIAAAVTGLGGITIAVAKSLSLEDRVSTLERNDREDYGRVWRMDAKLDIVMTRFGIEIPPQLQSPLVAPTRPETP